MHHKPFIGIRFPVIDFRWLYPEAAVTKVGTPIFAMWQIMHKVIESLGDSVLFVSNSREQINVI
jgi:hypothetical protein